MTFQGIEYDLRDINDRMALSEKLLADLCRIFESGEMKAMALVAHVHAFTVPKELSSRNAVSIATAREFLQTVGATDTGRTSPHTQSGIVPGRP